jgi:hypothetical protein
MLTANKSNAKKTLNAPPNGVSNLTMTKAQIQQRRAELIVELAELNDIKPEQAPWEPQGGPLTIFLNEERPIATDSCQDYAQVGLEYKTIEAAQKALALGRFYMRLVALAAELNPSGVAGGKWHVVFANDISRWEYGLSVNCYHGFNLFQTYDAAKEAADILNRDGWTMEGDDNA